MLVRLLRHRSIGLSPEAKFFLLRFLQEEQKDQKQQVDTLATLNVRKIAKRIGVTPKVAGSAIEQLVSLGLLTKQSKLRQLGRPSNEHRCSIEAVEKLLGSTKDNPGQVPRVAELLSGAVRQDGQRLLYANRLLLSVLLAHADEFGVVRGLGSRDLSDLTSLGKDVLANRLQLLSDRCFIRAYVPGATGSGLFRQMKSTYYLNLPLLSPLQAHADAVLIHCSWCKTYLNEMSEAERIFGFAAVLKEGLVPGDSYDLEQFPYLRHVEPLIDKLNDSRASRFVLTLQSRLDDYASTLLSSGWNEIQNQTAKHGYGLFRRVYRECRVPRDLSGRADRPLRKALMLLLWGAAHHRAKTIQQDLIDDFSGVPLEWLTYSVMPSPKRRLKEAGLKEGQIPIVTTLLVTARQPRAVSGCHVATRDQYEQLSVEHLSRESVLPLAQSCLYGLLICSSKPDAGKDAQAD